MSDDISDPFDLESYGKALVLYTCPTCSYSINDMGWGLAGCSYLCPRCGITTFGEFECTTVYEEPDYDT